MNAIFQNGVLNAAQGCGWRPVVFDHSHRPPANHGARQDSIAGGADAESHANAVPALKTDLQAVSAQMQKGLADGYSPEVLALAGKLESAPWLAADRLALLARIDAADAELRAIKAGLDECQARHTKG